MADAIIGAVDKKDPLAGVVDPSRSAKNGASYDDEKQSAMSIVAAMHNHRRLTSRQISLLAMAGTIG